MNDNENCTRWPDLSDATVVCLIIIKNLYILLFENIIVYENWVPCTNLIKRFLLKLNKIYLLACIISILSIIVKPKYESLSVEKC